MQHCVKTEALITVRSVLWVVLLNHIAQTQAAVL